MPCQLNPDSRISRHPATVWTKLEGDVVVIDMERADYFRMNPLGGFIWERLEEPGTLASLVQDVQARFRVDPGQCLADLVAFLGELHDAGLVALGEAELPPGGLAPALPQ